MKILLDDGMQINKGTGIGKYSESLFFALKESEYVDVELLDAPKRLGLEEISRALYLKYINSIDFLNLTNEFDLVIFTNYVMPMRKLGCTTAVVVHDLVAFDLPDTLPLAYCIYNRLAIKHAMRNSDYVFTVSNDMALRMSKRFKNTHAGIIAAWPGLVGNIHPVDSCENYEDEHLGSQVGNKFFLFVSTVEKRKNVEQVIRAFAKLIKTEAMAADYKLVLAGRPGFGYSDILTLTRSYDISDRVVFTGYVSNSDCNLLYNNANAFVFPTSYEGFGFAQLECMACHTPIILSDIPVNREISRDYGIYFDLTSDDSLVEQMKKVVTGEIDYSHLSALADEYLQDFSWDELAKKYVEII